MSTIPDSISNWINGEERAAASGRWFDKVDPHTGRALACAARSEAEDVRAAVEAAKRAYPSWSATPAVRRGLMLLKIVQGMQSQQERVAAIVAAETGKSPKDARGETGAAIQCGLFYTSEGQRLYARTTTSGALNKYAMTIRQPIGVAGLIIAANTPIANVAWKIFPALICGNTAVLKAAEDTPATAWIMGQIAKDAGLPDGVLNILQGYGEEAGAPLVEHPDVGVISFTGSTEVGDLSSAWPGNALRGYRLNWAARIRWSYVMMQTWRMPLGGSCFPHSVMPASGVHRPAVSSYSMPSTSSSVAC